MRDEVVRVDVSWRHADGAPRALELGRDIPTLGIDGVSKVEVSRLYFLEGQGEYAPERLEHVVAALLVDSVTQSATWGGLAGPPRPPECHTIEVVPRAGVTDTVADNLVAAAGRLGFALQSATTGWRYVLHGSLSTASLAQIAARLIANTVVEQIALDAAIVPSRRVEADPVCLVAVIPVSEADDDGLLAISAARRLALDLTEMRAIQQHFRTLGRDPTDVEMETLAQTWSEHCSHKTFRARVTCTEVDAAGVQVGDPHVVNGILDDLIRRATEELDRPWVHSAFVDNAGLVAFDDTLDLAFKVETHNHPSAIEPFGGANTGVGGVVRDILGVSARPIANTDVLCFGPEDLPWSALPEGVLHPARVARGVVAGVEDYGNKMGIPTVSGAVLRHPHYTANPLVFVGCLGVLPRASHPRAPLVGDLVVVIGGRTGRDGLRGATFSSMGMATDTADVSGSAVQIGHPIMEKQVQEVVIQARDEGLYNAITDCGAGGLSSAVGEMAEELGAEIALERVPLKVAGLKPWEVWLSEAQERMVMAVPSDALPRLEALCEVHGVEATSLGRFSGEGVIRLRCAGEEVAALEVGFLHGGMPRQELEATWCAPSLVFASLPGEGAQEEGTRGERDGIRTHLKAPAQASAGESEGVDKRGALTDVLLTMMASPEIASQEAVVRRYDHEVQGGTVVKPYVGVYGDGPGDASVVVPREAWRSVGPQPGAALSLGINPFYGEVDPHAMAWAAVDEAMRNAVCVGADPERVALLDNFCWGDPKRPDELGSLVRAAQGCYEAARAYGAPFVSGKDSLHNVFVDEAGVCRGVPGTLLISAVGLVHDIRQTVTSDAKEAQDALYLVGLTRRELGGSAYLRALTIEGGRAPQPMEHAPATLRALHRAIASGVVAACHDCSEGGVVVAAAEMAIGGRLGVSLELGGMARDSSVDRDDVACFSESLCRFVVEVRPEHETAFVEAMCEAFVSRLGEVVAEPRVVVCGLNGEVVVDVAVEVLAEAWKGLY